MHIRRSACCQILLPGLKIVYVVVAIVRSTAGGGGWETQREERRLLPNVRTYPWAVGQQHFVMRYYRV